ncbi:Glutamine-dependent NAD(+) synthetase [Dirofilaria immitis]
MALQLLPEKNLSKLVRVPSRFIFNAKINIPAQMLRREECRVPFIVVHGPRSIEFELKINVAGLHPENSTLIVNSQSELRTQISGLIAIRFGASKDIDNIVDAETVLNEMQEMDFEHTFVMRSMDPFLESMHSIITSVEYRNGLIGLSILISYHAIEFMQFVKQKSRLRSLSVVELWNSQLNSRVYKDFEVFSTDSHSLMYSKWTLYMGTKYFHRLINENSSVNYARLDYPDDVIDYAFSLALQNWFHEELQKDIKKMRQILELLCILEPINVDLAIETVAIELESAIFDEWKYLDLDELVRILTLPKYWELEELKVAARSVILDVHSKQFQKQYNEQSTGSRCAIYQDLIFSGAMDETSKPIESELEKIKKMSWKMSMVEKTVEFMEESVSQ